MNKLNKTHSDGFRPNVGIVLFNREGKVWFGKRPNAKTFTDGKIYDWQFPQGGIDKDESAKDAAKRELFEETGIKSTKLLFITPGWLYYSFPLYMNSKKYKGQKQKWAIKLFLGDESEIDFNQQKDQEFCEWRWEDLSSIADQVVPFKRPVYLELQKSLEEIPDLIVNKFKS